MISSSNGFAFCCLACLLGSAASNLVSPGLEKCLDIMAELKEDGTRENLDDMQAKKGPIEVQLYKCHKKHNQDWEIINGEIKSQSLGRCLTVKDKVAANSNVELVECGGDNADRQKWELTGFGYVKSATSKFCLDVKAAKKDDGTREKWSEIKKHKTVNVHLYNCHDPEKTKRVNQLWEWAPVSGGHVVGDTVSKWQFLGATILKPNTAGNGSMALAAVGMASLFVAGIVIGLRVRQATRQQPMSTLSLE